MAKINLKRQEKRLSEQTDMKHGEKRRRRVRSVADTMVRIMILKFLSLNK